MARVDVKKRRSKKPKIRISAILLIFLTCLIISYVIFVLKTIKNDKAEQEKIKTDISKSDTTTIVTNLNETLTSTEALVITEETTVGETKLDNTVNAGTIKSNPVPASTPKSEEYLKESVFIGDSITAGLSGYKLVDLENVFADLGLRADNIKTAQVDTINGKKTVMDALRNSTFKNIYIMLGSNGVGWHSHDVMLDAYKVFIDNIKKEFSDAKIYIISVTPVAQKMEEIDKSEDGKILNSQIDSFNESLLEMSNENGVYYLDMNKELKGANGKLPDSVTTDGMHFDKATYQKFIDYILAHTVD